MFNKSIRKATHAGTWYTSSSKDLKQQLETWLNDAGEKVHGPARAIIAPHAGYQYCGSCSAHAYKEIEPSIVKRVFILGPSHHVKLGGCALSPAKVYETPLYNLTIDQGIYEELMKTCSFEEMTMHTDEEEHSIEMNLPFIAKVMEDHQFTIAPVLIGSLSAEREMAYGKIFAPYLADPHNLFIISSDFCHWGARFNYQYYDKDWGEIHESIRKLDELAIESIEKLVPRKFTAYLKEYNNTICGRHPISVLLCAAHHLINGGVEGKKHSMIMKFLNYAQSGKCLFKQDSSVSYAAASLVFN